MRGTEKQRTQPKLWTGLFVALVAFMLCSFIVGQGLNAGTSVFLSRIGYGSSVSGILAMVFCAAGAIARLTLGPRIDAKGPSGIIIGGTAILLAGTLLPIAAHSIPALFVARALQGFGFAAATTAASTAVADIVPRSRLGEGIGYSGLGQALAMSIGPALALALVATDPATNLFAGLSLAAVIALLLSLTTRIERHADRLPETCSWRMRRDGRLPQPEAPPKGISAVFERRALPGTIPMLVQSSAFGFGIFYVGLYGTELGIANAGLFYTISAIAMAVIRVASKSFMDRVLPIKIYTAAIACGIVAFGLLYFSPQAAWTYYVAGCFYGLSLGVSLPINQTVAVKNTPSERWGAANSLYMLASDVSIGIASLVWGYLNDSIGFGFTILCVIACIAAAYALAWICYPNGDKRSPKRG